MIIGASILDVMVRPADRHVFETGSSAAEDISISFGGDALNEATILAKMGKSVGLETVIGKDKAGKFHLKHPAFFYFSIYYSATACSTVLSVSKRPSPDSSDNALPSSKSSSR